MKARGSERVGGQGEGIAKAAFERIGFAFRHQRENDYGIDAHAELIDGETATGRLLAIQLKSGETYFSEEVLGGFVFRSDAEHVEYWLQHSLPVVICLCDVERGVVLWQHVSRETVVSTGKGYKIVIPDTQQVDDASVDSLSDVCTSVVPSSRLTELRIEDLSHAGAKRYSIDVLLSGGATKSEVAATVRQFTSTTVKRRYHRNHLVEGRWGDADADVVWLFVYASIDDKRQANWVCRSIWISEDLSDDMRPASFKGENIGAGITLDWRARYDDLAQLSQDRTLLKEEYLAGAMRVKNELNESLEALCAELEKPKDGTQSQSECLASTARVRERVREMYMEWSEFGLAPHECVELDRRLDEALALSDNVVELCRTTGFSTGSDLAQALEYCTLARQALANAEYELSKIR